MVSSGHGEAPEPYLWLPACRSTPVLCPGRSDPAARCAGQHGHVDSPPQLVLVGLSTAADHAGRGHSRDSGGPTLAAGRRNRRSGPTKLTLHEPWFPPGAFLGGQPPPWAYLMVMA